MHLLIVSAAVILAYAMFFDRARLDAKGLFFVLQDYARQISRWLTFRRIVYAIAILVFVMAAWQALGFDWAFVAIGGDAMLYLEIVSTVYLVAVSGYIRQAATIVARTITGKMRKSLPYLHSRSRDRRKPRQNSSGGDAGDGDAEPGLLGVFALA